MPHHATHGSLSGIFLAFLLLGTSASGETSETSRGTSVPSRIYGKYCAPCHGKSGDGQTQAAKGMKPPPIDFTAPESLLSLTRERMLTSVQQGRPGTAMAAWGNILGETEITGVVDYIHEVLMPSSRVKDASLGRRLYASNCSVCHGDKGDVSLWARSGLIPPPRNFTTDESRQILTNERMIFSITYGRPETAMPPWGGRLNKKEIDAIVAYVRTTFLFPLGEPDAIHAGETATPGEHVHEHHTRNDMHEPMPNGLNGDPVQGKQFFDHQCADCHGIEGDGRGRRSDFISPKPRNLTHPASQHKYNRPHLFHVIANGEKGTEMSAWHWVMSNQEIANVAEYVFQKFIAPGLEDAGLTRFHP
ncbi:MAG: c-type cytochrome [Magnetococcus sp. DMHC-1]|nr:c-type cytochrome [Magnetococcales bacterium]